MIHFRFYSLFTSASGDDIIVAITNYHLYNILQVTKYQASFNVRLGTMWEVLLHVGCMHWIMKFRQNCESSVWEEAAFHKK